MQRLVHPRVCLPDFCSGGILQIILFTALFDSLVETMKMCQTTMMCQWLWPQTIAGCSLHWVLVQTLELEGQISSVKKMQQVKVHAYMLWTGKGYGCWTHLDPQEFSFDEVMGIETDQASLFQGEASLL